MKQIIFYTLYDAECAAMNFENDNPGTSIRRNSQGGYNYGVIDDRADAEDDPRFTENVDTWSGELPAIVVEDEKGYPVAKFGWWTDEID